MLRIRWGGHAQKNHSASDMQVALSLAVIIESIEEWA